MRQDRVDVITLAGHGDVSACVALCAALDREFPVAFRHCIYAPRSELARFAEVEGPRRSLAALDCLVPPGLLHTPTLFGFEWAWAPPFRLAPTSALRESLRLSATLCAETEVVALIDVDSALDGSLCVADLWRGARARFYRRPELAGSLDQAISHTRAASLLGLEPNAFGVSYEDGVRLRRRSVVRALVERIETTNGLAWGTACLRAGAVAEASLYGLFVDHVMGVERAGLFIDRRRLGIAGITGDRGSRPRTMPPSQAPVQDRATAEGCEFVEPAPAEVAQEWRRAG